MADETGNVENAGAQVPAVPRFWSSHASVVGTDKEVVILLGSSAIAVNAAGQAEATALPSCQVSMPLGAAKELVILLNDMLIAVEGQLGPVTTEFLRNRPVS